MISSRPADPPPAFAELGFNPLESDAYACVLRASEPATAYRVAQALGKPPAAVYKALEALEARGALLVEDGEHRRYRAVPVAELLRQVERRFRRTARELLHAWDKPAADVADDRVYRLATRDQVFERFASALAACEQFAQSTVCPVLLAECTPDLTAAAARGRFISLKVFAPAALDGVRVVSDPRGASAFENAPGQWLHLCVDGRETLLALFDESGATLRQAVWTASPFLSWTFFSGLICNHQMAAVEQQLLAGADARAVAEAVQALEPPEMSASRGKKLLVQRYRGPGRRGRSGKDQV